MTSISSISAAPSSIVLNRPRSLCEQLLFFCGRVKKMADNLTEFELSVTSTHLATPFFPEMLVVSREFSLELKVMRDSLTFIYRAFSEILPFYEWDSELREVKVDEVGKRIKWVVARNIEFLETEFKELLFAMPVFIGAFKIFPVFRQKELLANLELIEAQADILSGCVANYLGLAKKAHAQMSLGLVERVVAPAREVPLVAPPAKSWGCGFWLMGWKA